MNRDGHKDVVFFIGPEVEKTPAADKKTLFVVGKPPIEQILTTANEHRTPHVFMGANHSFSASSRDPYWDHVITALLDKGFWVTLDYQAHEHVDVLTMLNAGIWQSRLFVPLLGVRIPKIETSNNNLTVKIDDIDFDATNPGVWTLHFSELTDSNRFTGWQEYQSDIIVYAKSESAPELPLVDKKTSEKSQQSKDADVTAESDEAVKMNSHELGLDADSPSQLKPDDSETAKVLDVIESKSAAEAYAEGAKEDPLSQEASKKPTKKGKAA